MIDIKPGDTVTVTFGDHGRTGTVERITYNRHGVPWEVDVRITPDWTIATQPRYVRRAEADHG